LLPVGRILRGDHAGIAVSIPFDLFSGWKVSKTPHVRRRDPLCAVSVAQRRRSMVGCGHVVVVSLVARRAPLGFARGRRARCRARRGARGVR
jgi:hypothetical protein